MWDALQCVVQESYKLLLNTQKRVDSHDLAEVEDMGRVDEGRS